MHSLDKSTIRQQAHAARAAQPNKDQVSQQIVARAMSTAEYATAKRVLFYVEVRDEVRTRHGIQMAWEQGKEVIVPFCVGPELQLFHLEHWDQLAPGHFGVLEPLSELRTCSHLASPRDIDLVLAPGVAFDRLGGRMGHGKGFYDRLLVEMPPATFLCGLAYDCQIVDRLATEPHDIPMDAVVTQSTSHVGAGRTPSPGNSGEDTH